MRIQVLIRRIIVRHIAEFLEAVFPEHTFRVLAPGAPIAHSNLCVDWVRLGNIAFKHSYLLGNESLICQSDLIHVQEGDEFLATNLVIHTIAVGVTYSVKYYSPNSIFHCLFFGI